MCNECKLNEQAPERGANGCVDTRVARERLAQRIQGCETRRARTRSSFSAAGEPFSWRRERLRDRRTCLRAERTRFSSHCGPSPSRRSRLFRPGARVCSARARFMRAGKRLRSPVVHAEMQVPGPPQERGVVLRTVAVCPEPSRAISSCSHALCKPAHAVHGGKAHVRFGCTSNSTCAPRGTASRRGTGAGRHRTPTAGSVGRPPTTRAGRGLRSRPTRARLPGCGRAACR